MQSFSARILAWFDIHGRKHLPWQQQPSAYKTWVSEVMLQQTQVVTVIPYFNRFMQRFPTINDLANASLDDVLAHWAGLGYYSRARNLHKAAQSIRDQYQAVFPTQFDDVINLPGIGRSTAGAILSLAYHQRHAILDGNVKRVLSRHQMIAGIPNQASTLKKQWQIAEQLTPFENSHKYTQAMMDLGAMICTRSKPKCDDCPIHIDCQAKQQDKISDYPNKKPKKVLPERQTVILIITDGTKTYLEKRPSKGIWGGLWSLPEIPFDSQLEPRIADFLAQHQLQSSKQQQHAVYTHTFTHYRLHIHPISILTEFNNQDNTFTSAQYTQMGLPTPIRRILEKI